MMTDVEVAWLAGLLEGEGCFAFSRTPKIALSMTDGDIVKRAANLFGSAFRCIGRRSNQLKDVYLTEVHGERSIALMLAILPYMGSRRSARIGEVIALARARPGAATGERAGSSRLTDVQAEELLAKYVKGSRRKGERTSDLAKQYGISQHGVWYVVNKRKTSGGATLTKR